MSNLITIQDIRNVRPIAANIDINRYEQFIEEAQNLDLKQALNSCSKDFVYFLTQNTTVARIQLLLEGGTYTYQNETYSIVGLNKALALYAYARIIEATDLTVTGHGIVQKTNDWSNNSAVERVAHQAQNARTIAYQYVGEVVDLLCRLAADYPEYGGVSNAPKSFTATRVNKFDKTKLKSDRFIGYGGSRYR